MKRRPLRTHPAPQLNFNLPDGARAGPELRPTARAFFRPKEKVYAFAAQLDSC